VKGQTSLPAIHKLLTKEYGVQISLSHGSNLLRLGLAMVRCHDIDSEVLKAKLRKQGGVVVSIDAVNFDEGSAAVYVV